MAESPLKERLLQLAMGMTVMRAHSDHALPGETVTFRVLPPARTQRVPVLVTAGGVTNPVVSPVETPVQVEVEWRVAKPSSTQPVDKGYRTVDSPTRKNEAGLKAGEDYKAPLGTSVPEVMFIFQKPAGGSAQQPVTEEYYIYAQVKVTVGSLSTEWVELPRAPVTVIQKGYLDQLLEPLSNTLELVRTGSGLIVPGGPTRLQLLSPALSPSASGSQLALLPAGAGLSPLPPDIQVQVGVKWSVRKLIQPAVKNEHGEVLTPAVYETWNPGSDFEAPEGLQFPAATFLFPWRSRTEESAARLPLPLFIQAEIKLKAAGLESDAKTFELPVSLMTTEMLNLQIVRKGHSPVAPGQPVAFSLLSPALPLAADQTGAHALPPAPSRLRYLEIAWSVTPEHPEDPEPPVGAPKGLQLPSATFVFPFKKNPTDEGKKWNLLTYRVQAHVTLTAAGQQTRMTVPAIDVSVFPVEALMPRLLQSTIGTLQAAQPLSLKLLPPAIPGAFPSSAGGGGSSSMSWFLPDLGDLTPDLPAVPISLSNLSVDVLDADNNPVNDVLNELPSPLDVTLLITPRIVELRNDLSLEPNHLLKIKVAVDLSIGLQTQRMELPELDVPVLPLPIPKLMIMGGNPGFNLWQGESKWIEVAVPDHSPLKSLEQLTHVMDTLKRLLEPLRNLERVAGWLLGLEFVSKLATAKDVRFTVATRASDFEGTETPFKDNEASAVLYFGPWEDGVDLYNDENYRADHGSVLQVRAQQPSLVGIQDRIPELYNDHVTAFHFLPWLERTKTVFHDGHQLFQIRFRIINMSNAVQKEPKVEVSFTGWRIALRQVKIPTDGKTSHVVTSPELLVRPKESGIGSGALVALTNVTGTVFEGAYGFVEFDRDKENLLRSVQWIAQLKFLYWFNAKVYSTKVEFQFDFGRPDSL